MNDKFSAIGLIMAPQVKRFNDCEEKIERFKMIAAGEASTDLARRSILLEMDLTEFTDFSKEWNQVSTNTASNEFSIFQQSGMMQKQFQEYLGLTVKLRNTFVDVLDISMKERLMMKNNFELEPMIYGLSLFKIIVQCRERVETRFYLMY